MRTIILLRHAHAVLPGSNGKDFDRPLSQSGEAEAALQAQHLLQTGPRPDFVLSSAATRTMQTAEIFCDALNAAAPHNPLVIHESAALYRADAQGYLQEIRTMAPENAQCVLVVGHNPSIEDCALLFTRGHDDFSGASSFGFPTAGLAIIETVQALSAFSPQTAELTALYFPERG